MLVVFVHQLCLIDNLRISHNASGLEANIRVLGYNVYIENILL